MIITQNALVYLSDSLKKEDNLSLVIYVSVIYPGTQHAHVNITFCDKMDLNRRDKKAMEFNGVLFYVDFTAEHLLRDAVVDYKGFELIINAPHIYEKYKYVNLKDGIKSLFENEINVMLSRHGGFVEVIDVLDDRDIIVKFHGGCQGCSMVGYTLEEYIEKTVKKHFPSIERISDVTTHAINNSKLYY